MAAPQELIGQVFGRLTVLAREPNDRFGKTRWRCQCTCGKETVTRANTLLKGETRSCGCLHVETARVNNRTHGQRRTREYGIWCAMKSRCLTSTDKHYRWYGARGITICRPWQDSFEQFMADMGPRPPGMTLDRRDNEGHYTPENCHWATRTYQMRNTRRNRFVEFWGLRLTIAEWAQRMNLPYSALLYRLDHGWSTEKALTTPSRRSL